MIYTTKTTFFIVDPLLTSLLYTQLVMIKCKALVTLFALSLIAQVFSSYYFSLDNFFSFNKNF